MTKDEIIEMARKAGGIDLTNTRANVTIWIGTGTSDFLDAFAKLIAEKAIKESLAQTQEPVAFASHGVVNWIADKQFQHEADLYTSPPQIKGCAECGVNDNNHALYCVACAEKYLKDKNMKSEQIKHSLSVGIKSIQSRVFDSETDEVISFVKIPIKDSGLVRCDAKKQLTDDEIKSCWNWETDCQEWAIEFARAILRKAQEK